MTPVGGLAEWSMAADLKSVVLSAPGVRILCPPPLPIIAGNLCQPLFPHSGTLSSTASRSTAMNRNGRFALEFIVSSEENRLPRNGLEASCSRIRCVSGTHEVVFVLYPLQRLIPRENTHKDNRSAFFGHVRRFRVSGMPNQPYPPSLLTSNLS